MTTNELAKKLDNSLEAHQKELEFIMDGDEPLSRDAIIQLSKTSFYTLSQFRDAIVEFAKSIEQ